MLHRDKAKKSPYKIVHNYQKRRNTEKNIEKIDMRVYSEINVNEKIFF